MLFLIVGVFMLMDFISGLIKAFKEQNYTSTKMREGLFHKCGSVLCVLFGILVDYSQSFVDLGVVIPMTTTICTYIILMECGSILENIHAINPEILPEKISKYLKG